MKGVVFTEFLEMVEEGHGLVMVDQLLQDAGLAEVGFTSVGTYPCADLVKMVVSLSKRADTSIPDLLFAFGDHLFGALARSFPEAVAPYRGPLHFLEALDGTIHVEVKKLYPDAELPKFQTRYDGDDLIMIYESPRAMSDLARGLIEGCSKHYGQKCVVATRALKDDSGTNVEFRIQRVREAA